MRSEWRNEEHTIAAIIHDNGHVVIVEPDSPEWGMVVAMPPAAYVAPEPDPEAELAAWRARATVSRFQARAALMDAGLLGIVEVAMADADPLEQLAWAEAVEFRRDSPTVTAIAARLALSPAALDALFLAAAQIVV